MDKVRELENNYNHGISIAERKNIPNKKSS